MRQYIVDWSENVFANTPEQAAQKALNIQISKEMATFVVTERVGKITGRCWCVDISDPPEKRFPQVAAATTVGLTMVGSSNCSSK